MNKTMNSIYNNLDINVLAGYSSGVINANEYPQISAESIKRYLRAEGFQTKSTGNIIKVARKYLKNFK